MADQTPLMKFKVPNVQEIEGYAVELPDGRIELRTKEQLAAMPKAKEAVSGEQQSTGKTA